MFNSCKNLNGESPHLSLYISLFILHFNADEIQEEKSRPLIPGYLPFCLISSPLPHIIRNTQQYQVSFSILSCILAVSIKLLCLPHED
jgi:hypothetical protein